MLTRFVLFALLILVGSLVLGAFMALAFRVER